MVSWVVPKLMELWDDEGADVNRTLDVIIYGVLHHPAQRDGGSQGAREGRALIFQTVEEWWSRMNEDAKEEYRQKLSRRGVERGENHKEGVHDTGHGCGGKLHMHKNFTPETLEDKIAGAAVNAIMGGVKQGVSNLSQGSGLSGGSGGSGLGGSAIGGFIGGFLGGGFNRENTETSRSTGYTEDGGYNETTTEYAREGNRYGQSQYSETHYDDGSERREYRRYEQEESSRGGYGGYEERREEHREESYGRQDNYGSREEGYERSGEYRRGDDEYQEPEEESSGGGFFGDVANRVRETLEETEEDGNNRGWGY